LKEDISLDEKNELLLRDGADSASCIKEKAKQKELEADVKTKRSHYF
jgi:hypothetical protein